MSEVNYKYIVMVINEDTHEARKAIVTRDVEVAQKETRIRVGQGLRAYYIRKEIEK